MVQPFSHSVLIFHGFHNHSASFRDEESGGTREEQEQEVTLSWKQWLLLERLAWMLQGQFYEKRMALKEEQRAALTAFLGGQYASVLLPDWLWREVR